MNDKELQVQLDAANAKVADLTKANAALKAANDTLQTKLDATTEELATVRAQASQAQLAANGGNAPPQAGPPVLMTCKDALTANIGGIKKYACKAGEFIKVELAHVEFLMAHGFRHLTPEELVKAGKQK